MISFNIQNQLLFSHFGHIRFCATPRTTACQTSLSFIISQSLLKLMSIELGSHPAISSSVVHFSSCLQSFPASGRVFSNESALPIRGGQSTGVSESVLPMNIDFLYGWLIWTSCSPRDSQESSPTPQFKSINYSAHSFLYGSALTSIHDYEKNNSFNYTDLCWQSNVSAF